MLFPTLALIDGDLVNLILIMVVVLGVFSRFGQASPLVLKSWYASDKPLPDGSYIHITGRRAGLVGFLFSLLGIDPVTTLKVTNKRIEFHSSSLTGTFHRITPLNSVSSSYFGFSKPLVASIVVGVVAGVVIAGVAGMALFGAMSPDFGIRRGTASLLTMLVGLGGGGVMAFIYYKFNVTQTVGFVELSGDNYYIRFKPSVIEGVSVNEAKAKYAAELIQHFIQSRVDR